MNRDGQRMNDFPASDHLRQIKPCHPERSEAPAERSRRTPCLPAVHPARL